VKASRNRFVLGANREIYLRIGGDELGSQFNECSIGDVYL
jgi:hypothetical protein